ncbi:MAG: hypothetical protein HY716_06520 [Planctomycetes bacterium]|nr:hypothetical protein [Planctomycetota bacterium]
MRMPLLPLLLLVVPSPRQQEEDLLFRVLDHEIERSMKRLRIDPHPPPYYVGYTIRETDTYAVGASFGALAEERGGRARRLKVDLRVGDYDLDNTNFDTGDVNVNAVLGVSTEGSGRSLTVDDDYDALRHDVWLATDAVYKEAVEQLEKKKAYLQENVVKDRPADFSRHEPVVRIGSTATLELDRSRWADTVRKVSGVFREYSRVQNSVVLFVAQAQNRWFRNSEGFQNRAGEVEFGVVVMALAQADDGMKVSDYEAFRGRSEKDMPALPEIEKAARGLADRLSRLTEAPPMEQEYRGPVLFEGAAAAEFFGQILPLNLGNAHETIGGSNPMAAVTGNQWREKLGTRVMSEFLSVVSDPTLKDFRGKPVWGGHEVDDDGVGARRVVLVESGILKTFCMSRKPARHVKESNGHSQGGVGTPSTLLIHAGLPVGLKELKDRLLDLGKEEGMEFVYIIRRLSTVAGAALNPQSLMSSVMARFAGGAETGLLPPILTYRVSVRDGREQLVRGARFGRMTLRVLRDIGAAGEDVQAHLTVRGAQDMMTVIAPSILVKEIELQKPDKETEKPPVLKHPYFEK